MVTNKVEKQKELLIGFANNISKYKNQISLWYNSFKKHSNSRVVLIAANINKQEAFILEKIGVEFISISLSDTAYINHKRIEYILNFLENTNEELILSTDVFDVAFQANPFVKLNSNYDFFVASECINVCNEPWNSNNINSLFPQYYSKCHNNEVICSGVIAGKRNKLLHIYTRLLDLCDNHSTNKHNIKDQAALIVMINNNEIDKIKIFNLHDAWAVHCAVAGPTQFFDKWGFDRHISKYGIPKIVDNKVYNSNNNLFDIVHQFNRIKEWNTAINQEYLNGSD